MRESIARDERVIKITKRSQVRVCRTHKDNILGVQEKELAWSHPRRFKSYLKK